MKLTKTLLALLLLWTSLAAGAQEATIRKNLAERIPQLKNIDEVTKSPVPGLFEIRVNGTEIFRSPNVGATLTAYANVGIAAAPADNAPTGAPSGEAAPAREAGADNTRVNAAGEASGANADPAALEGSGSTTAPEHHLGFAATMGFAGALVAAVALFFWRRKRT